MTGRSSRRDFLFGKAAAREMGDLVLSALPEDPPEPAVAASPAEHYLLHVSRRAMACEFQVYLNVGQYEQGTEVALEVLDLVGALEEQLSFFRPSSELSAINRHAGDGPVVMEPGLFGLLEMALRVGAQTHGALDITSTPLWEVWGFSRRAGRMPEPAEIAAAMQHVGSHLVDLDAQQCSVRFRQPDVRLNLGSMGKGYALDRAVERMQTAGIEHFLIHAGQSSVIARGAQGSTVDQRPDSPAGSWLVGIRHPLRPDRRLGEVRLRDRALGTSGSQAQSFWHQGRRYGHILDPRTGSPASQVFSATVLAPSAALADALSTAFYVLEPDATLEYCQARPEIAAVLVCPARRPGGFEVRTVGLAEGELVLFSQVDGPRPAG